MLKFTFCPTFTIKSFIFFISMVDIIMYIITLVISISKYSLSTDSFLGPYIVVLNDFGGKNPYLMRYNYEVWRFLTPIFLHGNLLHIIVHSIFLTLIVKYDFSVYYWFYAWKLTWTNKNWFTLFSCRVLIFILHFIV